MFTDNPVTPVRLEILVDLLRQSRQGLSRDDVYRLLQPEPLAGVGSSFTPAKATVRAGLELELVEESNGTLALNPTVRRDKEKGTKEVILAAFDEKVMANSDVEKYFALFYSYYLGLGKQVYGRAEQENDTWADQFNEAVFGSEEQENRFNGTKLTGLHRWFSYVGLGWYDPASKFQAVPYERIERALPAIFWENDKLDAQSFMTNLAEKCLELDGGEIFTQANGNWDQEEKKCTLGLSHALIELHLDGRIRLHCPADTDAARGDWSLVEAEPPRDDNFKSERFTTVERLKRN